MRKFVVSLSLATSLIASNVLVRLFYTPFLIYTRFTPLIYDEKSFLPTRY